MTEPVRGQDHRGEGSTNVGAVIGRPDLDEATMLAAIERRLESSGDGRKASDLLAGLRDGEAEAIAFVRTTRVPPPVAKLAMPTHRLTLGRRATLQAALTRLISTGR